DPILYACSHCRWRHRRTCDPGPGHRARTQSTLRRGRVVRGDRARHGEPFGSAGRLWFDEDQSRGAQECGPSDSHAHHAWAAGAIVAARKIIQVFAPDVVVGVGGYASGPAMAAAIIAKIPTLAFEPNLVPGFANKIIGQKVSAAAVHFE